MSTPNPATFALVQLRASNPEAFRAAIRAPFEATGRWVDAARQLGVPERTLRAWIKADPSILRGVRLHGAGFPWDKVESGAVTSRKLNKSRKSSA